MSPFDENTIISQVFTVLNELRTTQNDLQKNQNETCVSLAEVKTILTTHLEHEKERSARKEKIFYGVLGVFGAIVSIIQVMSSGIIG